MEDQPIFTSNRPVLHITQMAEGYLGSIKKWARFFSILGFIAIGIMLIAAIAVPAYLGSRGDAYGAIGGGMISGLYIVMGILYLFPVLYLFKFANNLDKALVTKSSDSLELAFRNLKSNFQFVGIMCILMIILYVILGLGAAFFAFTAASA